MTQLQSSNRLQTAASLLFAGYSFEQTAERSGCSEEELSILHDLLDARLIIPQPTAHLLEDGHIDVVKEFSELIPVFKGQVHVAILSTSIGVAPPKGSSAPELIKDYATMLLQLFKLYQMAGISTSYTFAQVDEPTLKALLDGN